MTLSGLKTVDRCVDSHQPLSIFTVTIRAALFLCASHKHSTSTSYYVTFNCLDDDANRPYADRQRWAPGRIQRIQNVPRSAWVKTDAASMCVSTNTFAVLLATSIFTHALRSTFCTPPPPQVPTSEQIMLCHIQLLGR